MNLKNRHMKFFSLVIGLLLISFSMKSQEHKIETSGNIGIGTTTPTNKLHVSTSSSNDGIFLNGSNSNTRFIMQSDSGISSGKTFALNIHSSNDDLIFQSLYDNKSFRKNLVAFQANGNVGINTITPTHILEIETMGHKANDGIFLNGNSTNNRIVMRANNGIYNQRTFAINVNSSNNDLLFQALAETNASLRDILVLQHDGNVGIGKIDPKNKLSVDGTIWAKEVKVSLTDAADWVFEDDYDLRTLEEVDAYIKENKHLPEMPSAEELRQNDLNVAEMDNKLLLKVEELTLYMIQMNKEVIELKKQNQNLEKELSIIKNN